MFRAFVSIALALSLGSTSFANGGGGGGGNGGNGNCDGDAGYKLKLDDKVKIGETFHMTVKAPQGNVIFVLISAGDGPTQTPYGTFCLDFPPAGIFAFLQPCNEITFPHFVPCNPVLVGATGYFQYIAIAPNGVKHRSNMEKITVKDNNHCDCGGNNDDDSSDDCSDDHSSDDCSDDHNSKDHDSHDHNSHDHDSDDCDD